MARLSDGNNGEPKAKQKINRELRMAEHCQAQGRNLTVAALDGSVSSHRPRQFVTWRQFFVWWWPCGPRVFSSRVVSIFSRIGARLYLSDGFPVDPRPRTAPVSIKRNLFEVLHLPRLVSGINLHADRTGLSAIADGRVYCAVGISEFKRFALLAPHRCAAIR